MKNVVLAGLKHSGKSTLGRLLAAKYSLPFFDLDDLLETQAPLNRGYNSREIYRHLGRETFQNWESLAAREMGKKSGPWVLALGGGTVQNPSALEALGSQNLRLFLEESPEILFSRIMAGGLPAFLDPEDPRGSFQKIVDERTGLLRNWCSRTLTLSGADVSTALEMLIQYLKENDHGW